MQLLKLMTSHKGRVMRILVGFVIMGVGLLLVRGLAGTLIAVFALLPIAGGLFDFCPMGAILGYPLRGPEARKEIARKQAGRG